MSRLHAFPLAKIIIVIHLFTFSELRYFGPNRSHCLIDTGSVSDFRTPIFFLSLNLFAAVFTFISHVFHYTIIIGFVNPYLEQFFNFL